MPIQKGPANLGTGTIDAAELASGSVTTAKIADANVTSGKLASGAAVSNIGYTPANKAGDTFTGYVEVGNTVRVTSISNPASGSGMELAYDGTQGIIQTYSNRGALTSVPVYFVNGQIKFPASQNASGDANTLDDYEEGTWTPIMTSENGSITSYTSSGTYTKIGNIVTVTGYTVLTTVGTAGGRAFIAGFPFAGTSSTDFIQPGSISRESQATGYIYFAYINGGNTNGVIQNATAGAIGWANGYRYSWTITYKC